MKDNPFMDVSGGIISLAGDKVHPAKIRGNGLVRDWP
jgi:hypothetical protein